MKKLALTLLLAACAAKGSDDPDLAGGPTLKTTTAPIPQAPITGDWRARVAADVAALRASDPDLYTELAKLAPHTTRAGHLRFTTRVDRDPRAAAVFLDRLASGRGSEAERAALVEALPRTGGNYADAIADLMAADASAVVRGAYVFAARRAPADLALPVLRRGFADTAPDVRAEAARAAGAHASGAQLAGELRTALSDRDDATRTGAARALGILGIAGARAELLARLGDASPDVRLEAMRALERIAPGSLGGHPGLTALRSDADPRVARLAQKLAVAAP